MLGSLVTSSRRMGGPIGFAGLIAGLVLVLAEVAFGSHAAAHEEHAGSVHPLGAETGGTATRVRLPEVELVGVVDTDAERAASVAAESRSPYFAVNASSSA